MLRWILENMYLRKYVGTWWQVRLSCICIRPTMNNKAIYGNERTISKFKSYLFFKFNYFWLNEILNFGYASLFFIKINSRYAEYCITKVIETNRPSYKNLNSSPRIVTVQLLVKFIIIILMRLSKYIQKDKKIFCYM